MVRCTFLGSSVYCDFYFLLELAGVPQIPAPHRGLLGLQRLPTAVRHSLAEWRTLHPWRNGVPDGIFGTALACETQLQLAEIVTADGFSRAAGNTLLKAAARSREQIVTGRDRALCAALVERTRELLQSDPTKAALARLQEFFVLDEAVALQVAPYPLSAGCAVSFGSLTGALVTLGLHPEMTAERIIGIIVHEAVHAWTARRLSQDRLPELLIEPLATAIGNGWMVSRLSGAIAGHAWYDNHLIDGAARALFQEIAEAIAARESFESTVIKLIGTLEQSKCQLAREARCGSDF